MQKHLPEIHCPNWKCTMMNVCGDKYWQEHTQCVQLWGLQDEPVPMMLHAAKHNHHTVTFALFQLTVTFITPVGPRGTNKFKLNVDVTLVLNILFHDLHDRISLWHCSREYDLIRYYAAPSSQGTNSLKSLPC